MGKAEAKSTYVHYVPDVRVVPEWHKNFNMVLVENMDMLRGIFNTPEWVPGKSCLGMDTETTGFDPEEVFLVGFSFCFDGKNAYYVPVNHYDGEYNMGDEAVDFIYEKMVEAFIVFWFNQKFDSRIFEYHGYDKEKHSELRFLFIRYDLSKVNMFDVAVPVFLADSNVKFPSLKGSTLKFLGFKMVTYAEVSDGVESFYYVSPKDAAFYAASDALCTYLLVPAVMKYFKEAGMSGKINIKVNYPLQHFEQEKVYLDGEVLKVLDVACHARLEELERKVYDEIGYFFNMNSPAQVSNAFSRLGIDTGERTSKGFMKTGVEYLEALPEEIKAQHPALKMFVEYKLLSKFTNSYVNVFNTILGNKGYIRCNYMTTNVPTGRLASGKDAKNTFFSEINVQALPKPHPGYYYVLDMKDRNLFSRRDNIILGYKFVPVEYEKDPDTGKATKNMVDGSKLFDNFLGVIEGMSTKDNIRASLLPKMYRNSSDDDWLWCSIDFAGQELRIATNFSKEPVWTNAFKSGGDIHKDTAISIWGEENYDKEKRKSAKGANFAKVLAA